MLPRTRLDEADDGDVAELGAGAEPLRSGQRLQHRQPHHEPGGEERDVLERVHRAVPNGRLVEERQVPEVEIDRPERECDERVGEHPQTLDRPERQQRPQDRACRAGEQAERREIADQHVLEHVEAEELLLADRGDRRREREQQERDSDREDEHPPASAPVSRASGACGPAARRRAPAEAPAASWSGSSVQLVRSEGCIAPL